MAQPGFRLVERPANAVLFHTVHGPLTTLGLLRRAHRIAARLPDAAVIANGCHDRGLFTALFLACVIRNRPCLLVGDRPAEQRTALLADAPEAALLWDQDLDPINDTAADEDANPMIAADQPASIVFTSGSTGRPVAHLKNWGALARRSIAAGQQFGLSEANPATVVATVPPQHMYGFETSVLQPLHAPCASWCGDAFYPADIRTALAAVPGPRLLVTTPLQIRVLLGAGTALPELAAVISATAPLDESLAEAAEAHWGAEAWEIFGATEIGSVASRRTLAGPDWTLYPGIRFQPGDTPDSQQAVAAFAPPVTLADRVAMRDERHFRLLGRRTDLIKLGGRRASLAGLNRILNGLDGVQDGVFLPPSDPDRDPGARMTAFVVAPDRTPEQILAALRDRIDPVFLPRRVIALPALPRDAVGKMPLPALTELASRIDPA